MLGIENATMLSRTDVYKTLRGRVALWLNGGGECYSRVVGITFFDNMVAFVSNDSGRSESAVSDKMGMS